MATRKQLTSGEILQNVGIVDQNGTALDNGAGALSVVLTSNTPDLTATGTLSSNASTTLALAGQSAVTFQLIPSAFTGVVNFEASDDGGTTYFPIAVWPLGVTPTGNLVTSVTNPAANALYEGQVAAMSHVRARVSGFAAGSVAVTIRATQSTASVVLDGPLPTGTNSLGSVVQGTAAALAAAWPVKVTDGTNTAPTGDAAARAVFQQNAAASQVDGHSATIGTTTDTSAANTVIGRLKALIALLPAALGRTTMANSLSVAVASDQAAFPVITESQKTTYSAAVSTIAPVAAATDFAEIFGSGTKTIRVTRLQISGVATTAADIAVTVSKRSAADTLGGATRNAMTVVPHDANDAAGTATPAYYSVANPTPGAAVGNVRAGRVSLGGGAVAAPPLVYDFTTRNEKGIVLRGVAQGLSVNLGGAALQAGQVMDVEWTWTEE